MSAVLNLMGCKYIIIFCILLDSTDYSSEIYVVKQQTMTQYSEFMFFSFVSQQCLHTICGFLNILMCCYLKYVVIIYILQQTIYGKIYIYIFYLTKLNIDVQKWLTFKVSIMVVHYLFLPFIVFKQVCYVLFYVSVPLFVFTIFPFHTALNNKTKTLILQDSSYLMP